MALSKPKLFDTHFHIIDGRFPLLPNNAYLPEEFACHDYLNRMKGYSVIGGLSSPALFRDLIKSICSMLSNV